MRKSKNLLVLTVILLFVFPVLVFAQEETEKAKEGESTEAVISAFNENAEILKGKFESLADQLSRVEADLGKPKNIFPVLIEECIVVAGILSVLILPFLLLLLMNFKTNKKIKNLSEKLQELETSLEQYKAAVRSSTAKQPEFTETDSSNRELESKIEDHSAKLTRLDEENRLLKNRMDGIEKDTAKLKNDRQTAEAVSQDPLSVFNEWAKNPVTPLPSGFYYLQNNIRIRSSQPLVTSTLETKWISNSGGIRQYLFPNPNSFNEMTNISELYVIKAGALKPKGQNRLQITKPCEMKDRGYIDFPGELRLL
ncbi:MAG: hypothetical protein LBO04_08505 [Spirochaetaceae bacterium]|jgi:type II secretory pathway pseudopilin PulG|nr:hypothetical protein [Spirochaetaceae bacterium]